MTVREKRAKRAQLVAEARELVEKADEETRAMNAEEEATWDRVNAEIDRLELEVTADEQQERRSRVTNLEHDLARRDAREPPRADVRELTQIAAMGVEERARLKLQTREYSAAFLEQCRFGNGALTPEQLRVLRDPELRALQVGTTTEGGHLVPTDLERQLVEVMREENIMRSLSTVKTFGNDRNIPVRDGNATATWVAEEGAFLENDPTFAQVALAAFKAGVLLKVSDELLQDQVVDLNSHLATELGRATAALTETAYVNGNGTAKPTGVVVGSSLGKTAAATGAVTGDELIDLHDSLKRIYANRATFMMAGPTRTAVRKLKDGNGQYLWQPGLQAGHPDNLLGRPVAISDDMPAMTTGLKSIIFGDFKFYWIADRAAMFLKRLEELYAVNGQIGFRLDLRTDGKLTLAEAVKHLIQA